MSTKSYVGSGPTVFNDGPLPRTSAPGRTSVDIGGVQ